MTHEEQLEYWTYENFLNNQYHIRCNGLYHVNDQYYIVCPEVDENTCTREGYPIYKWFQSNKAISATCELVNVVPEGAVKVENSSARIDNNESGFLFTKFDYEYEIDLLIPSIFPDYTFIDSPSYKVIFSEFVPEPSLNELRRIFMEARFPLMISFENNLDEAPIISSRERRPLHLSTFRQVKGMLPPLVSKAWEGDQDNWVDIRKSIICQHSTDFDIYKPKAFKDRKLRCLIDCLTGKPSNIRSYLTLYDQLCIVMPHNSRLQEILNALCVSENELVELTGLDKIHILLPQSIERYNSVLLERLVEIRHQNVHFARSMSIMTFMEMQKRNPLVYPNIAHEERKILFKQLESVLLKQYTVKNIKQQVESILSDLGRSWMDIPTVLNQSDSLRISAFGLSWFLSSLLVLHGRDDLSFDIVTNSSQVEWASATGSVLEPARGPDFDTYDVAKFIAGAYSGAPLTNEYLHKQDNTNFAASGILTIADDVPVVELASSFQSFEVNRLRNLVYDVCRHNASVHDVSEAIDNFNKEVKRYDKKRDKFAQVDLLGFISSVISKHLTAIELPQWVPDDWILKTTLKQSSNYAFKSRFFSSFADNLLAGLMFTSPDAILVSRINRRLRK